MAACEPKQNNCEKSGTGPDCSGCQECGNNAKRRCLEEAKKNCEEKLKKCVEKTCIEENVKRYEREKDERARAREAQNKAEADRLAKCYNTTAYEIANGKFKYWLDKGTFIAQYLIAKGSIKKLPEEWQRAYSAERIKELKEKWKEIIKNGIPGLVEVVTGLKKIKNDKNFATDIEAGPKDNLTDPNDPNDTGTKVGKDNNSKAQDALKNELGQDTYFVCEDPCMLEEFKRVESEKEKAHKEMEKLCPPAKVDPPFDELEEQRRYNEKIARCIADCHQQAVSDCKTVQCYCGLYKCPAGQIKYNGLGGGGGGGTKFPEKRGTDDTAKEAQFSITSSSYEIPIELMYTRSFFPGNILWVSPKTEERRTVVERKLVKDGVNQTLTWEITNKLFIDTYISFVIGVCAGPVEAVTRVWLDGNLIYDVSAGGDVAIDGQGKMEIIFHNGSEHATVMADVAEIEGFERVPAYRGIATLFIKNLNIKSLRQFPKFRIEVIKRTLPNKPAIEGAAVTGIDTSSLFRIDTAARRVFVGTSTGMKILDYTTLEPLVNRAYEDTIPDLIDVTPLPYAVTWDGTDLKLIDVTYGTERSAFTPDIVPDAFAMFRFVDQGNLGYNALLSSNTNGDIDIYPVIDSRQDVIVPSDWQRASFGFYSQFPGVLSGAMQGVATLTLTHTDPSTGSEAPIVSTITFVMRGEGAELQSIGLIQNTTGSLVDTLAEDAFNIFYDPVIFDGASDVSVRGVYPCDRDNTMIVFLAVDATFVVIKWTPYLGIVWQTEVNSLPVWGVNHEPGRRGLFRLFKWIGLDDVVYSLDTDTGDVFTVDAGSIPGIEPTSGHQYYDAQLGAITYDDGAGISRVYIDRVAGDIQTLTEVIRDVAERAGVENNAVFLDGVTDVEILGYRSGNAITARAVLEPLFEVYPVVSYADFGLGIVSKGDGDLVVVEDDWLLHPFKKERKLDAYDTRAGTINYYSYELDGEDGQQVFRLPDDVYDGKNEIAFGYTVIEHDDYMRALIELKVFAAQENDEDAEILIPPRYLAVAPGDLISNNGNWRGSELSINADMSITVKLKRDSAAKYNELIAISGILGFGNLEKKAPFTPVPYPLVWTGRCISPRDMFSQCIFYGASELLDDFYNPYQIGITEDEQSGGVPNGDTFGAPQAWGYLVTPPTDPGTQEFTSQPNGSLVVKMNQRLYRHRFSAGETIQSMYFNRDENVLFVGDEHIRYESVSYDTDPMTGDGVTLTFHGLMRARDSTDQFMQHSVGELVMHYDYRFMHYQVASASDSLPIKVATGNQNGEIRRSDRDSRDALLTGALPVCSVARWDTGPDVVVPAIPDAKDIHVRYVMRSQNIDEFNDNAVAYYDSVSGTFSIDGVFVDVYLLRGEYDESAFEADKDTADTSYIIAGGDGRPFLTPETLSDDTLSVKLTPTFQDIVEFDMTLETLTAVLISNLGARRVVTWTPGDYTMRPTRGIVLHP